MTDAELKPCPFCGNTDIKSGGDDKIVGKVLVREVPDARPKPLRINRVE